MCSFSEDGHYIFAGCNDCCVYIWHWDLDLARKRSSSPDILDSLTRPGDPCFEGTDPNVLATLRCAIKLLQISLYTSQVPLENAPGCCTMSISFPKEILLGAIILLECYGRMMRGLRSPLGLLHRALL